MLLQELVTYARERCADAVVEDFCIGVGYTAVRLKDGRGGVCYTFRNDLGDTCGALPGAGYLSGLPVRLLAQWVLDENLAKTAVGMAAINAMLNPRFSAGENVSKAVTCRPEDVVGMVGNFCPLKGKFHQEAKQLYIFEREPVKSGFLPAAREPELLPQCDLVILSSTTLLNKTAEQILSWCSRAREIVMVGATTPMAPEVLRRYGITALAGIRITDADAAMRIVMQGGGAMDLTPAAEKLFERI